MRKIAALIIIALVGFVNNRALAQIDKISDFVIKGTIIGATDGSVVKLYDLDAKKVLDSARITKNKFVFKGEVAHATACYIEYEQEYAYIWVENTIMTFNSPLKNMVYEFKATGGKEQELVTQLNNKQYVYNKRYLSAYDSLQNKKYTDETDRKRLFKVFSSAQDTADQIYVDFGKHHPNSYYGQDIIYRSRKSIPRDTLESLYKSMSPSLKANFKGVGLKLFLYSTLAEKGKPMIDFEVKTINGKTFKLSSLKGNYIYLTFGDIACGACRMQNKAFAASYGQLSPLISLVTFSLDNNMANWKRMTKDDGIVWSNVSDLKGESGEIKALYNVQATPASFLIDKDGIIIRRWDDYADDRIIKIEKMVKGL